MSNLISVCGQVRGLESKLFNVNRLDRMVGAQTPEDAFRVLLELQYAEYIDQETTAKDFDHIITQGLKETHDILLNGSGNDPRLDFLWLRFDLNNISRALKQKLLEGKKELTDFYEDTSFSRLGKMNAAQINDLVFERRFVPVYSSSVINAVLEAESLYQKDDAHFQGVEFLLDQAYFSHLQGLLSGYGDCFCNDFYPFLVESTQIRNIARSILSIKQPITQDGWIKQSTLTYEKHGKMNDYESFKKLITSMGKSYLLQDIKDTDSDTVKLLAFENALDQEYKTYLSDRAAGSLDSVAILLNYFEKRMHNARLLKLVMYAQFNGLDSEKIYELLEKV